ATGRDTRTAARVAPRGLFVFCGPCALARSRLSLPVARVPGLASEDRRYPRWNACRSSRLVLGRAFRLPPRRRRLAKKPMSGGFKMKRSAAVRSAVLLAVRSAVLLGALAAGGAAAQQAATGDQLTATQKMGRQG